MANPKKTKHLRTVPARCGDQLRLGDAIDQAFKLITKAHRRLSLEEFKDFIDDLRCTIEDFESRIDEYERDL